MSEPKHNLLECYKTNPDDESPFEFGSKEHWKERCEAWNWNYNLAEIASELIDGGIKPRTVAFKKFAEAYKEFFNASERDVEMVENMLDVFGGF